MNCPATGGSAGKTAAPMVRTRGRRGDGAWNPDQGNGMGALNIRTTEWRDPHDGRITPADPTSRGWRRDPLRTPGALGRTALVS